MMQGTLQINSKEITEKLEEIIANQQALMEEIQQLRKIPSSLESEPMQMLRIKHVCSETGLSRSTIYNMVGEDRFPKPIRLGLNAVGWRRSTVMAWLDDRDQ